MESLDSTGLPQRELFEYWGTQRASCRFSVPACAIPHDKHLEQRRNTCVQRRCIHGQRLRRVTERGPLSAAELSSPGKRSGGWWAVGSVMESDARTSVRRWPRRDRWLAV